jgi:SAM-dependent methyltransferase
MNYNESKTDIIHSTRLQARLIYSNPEFRKDALKKIKLINDFSHKAFERSAPKLALNGRILELGCSSDINLRACKQNYSEYVLSDLNIDILQNTHPLIYSLNPDKIKIRKINAAKLKSELNNEKYDRIIACNLLEHLPSPETTLIDWYDCLNTLGTLSLLQPCDPGFLWRVGRELGHKQHCISKGLNYDLLMALEHINPANNIITIIKSLFPSEAKLTYFPFLVPSWNFNLFFFAHITKR